MQRHLDLYRYIHAYQANKYIYIYIYIYICGCLDTKCVSNACSRESCQLDVHQLEWVPATFAANIANIFGAGNTLTVAPMPEGQGGVLRREVTPIQNTCNQLLTLGLLNTYCLALRSRIYALYVRNTCIYHKIHHVCEYV